MIQRSTITTSSILGDVLPIILRRHSVSLLKTCGEVRRASEAAIEGDVGHGFVAGEQQFFRALQAEVLHVLHGCFARFRPEDPREVGGGEMGYRGHDLDGDLVIHVRVEVFYDAADFDAVGYPAFGNGCFDYRPDQGMADLDCEGVEHDVRSGASAVRFDHEPFEQVRESLGRTEKGPAKYLGFFP